jgi:hypothetical protein
LLERLGLRLSVIRPALGAAVIAAIARMATIEATIARNPTPLFLEAMNTPSSLIRP